VQEWKYGLGQTEDAEGAVLSYRKNGAQLSDAHAWPGKKGNQNTFCTEGSQTSIYYSFCI
jgi:hypothetical protein